MSRLWKIRSCPFSKAFFPFYERKMWDKENESSSVLTPVWFSSIQFHNGRQRDLHYAFPCLGSPLPSKWNQSHTTASLRPRTTSLLSTTGVHYTLFPIPLFKSPICGVDPGLCAFGYTIVSALNAPSSACQAPGQTSEWSTGVSFVRPCSDHYQVWGLYISGLKIQKIRFVVICQSVCCPH